VVLQQVVGLSFGGHPRTVNIFKVEEEEEKKKKKKKKKKK
jgi:hypothetical protein